MAIKKYRIVIEETIVQEFEIEAEESEDIIDLSIQKYKNGEFVLDAGEPAHKQISIIKPTNKTTEWIEF